MNFCKLRGKMAEERKTQAKLAQELGITQQSLNAKLNNRSQFTLNEAVKLVCILNIKDPNDIFFSQESQICNR